MKEKDYCRCCLSENCEKDMVNEYFFRGNSEVYSKMLTETYDIHISQLSENKCLICEDCISRLRDAAAFKTQVVATQQHILKLATLMDGSIDLKTELKTDDDDFDDRVSVFSEGDFAWGSETKDADEQIFAIKIDDKKENTCQPKPINKKSDKIKSDVVLTKTRAKSNTKKPQTNTKEKLNKGKSSRQKRRKLSEIEADRKDNTLKLLENSNLCLFTSHRIKYGCYACKETFLDITTLREHTVKHPRSKYLTTRISLLRGLTYKNVDISDLKCNKCNEDCTDLIDLKDHLISTHKLEFASNNHFLIPYRLKDKFRCVLCDEVFKTFARLSIHMNSHYYNNVCDVCGLSYINRSSLRMHYLASHKEKKCSKCCAVFLKNSDKKSHMRKVHNISTPSKRHCNQCDKTFQYTYLLNQHKIKEHNHEKPPLLQCSECDKTFLSHVNYRTHLRAVHLKERNHPCEVCGMRFFTKCDRMRHERTHEDVKRFSCAYCDVKFKCKDSSRRHMKRQHGHSLQS